MSQTPELPTTVEDVEAHMPIRRGIVDGDDTTAAPGFRTDDGTDDVEAHMPMRRVVDEDDDVEGHYAKVGH